MNTVARTGRAPKNAPPPPEVVDSIPAPPTQRPKRFCHLGATETHRLAQATMMVEEAFGEKIYLVGSVLKTPKFRDVDLRIILDDEQFRIVFGGDDIMDTPMRMLPFWSLVCNAVSEMLSLRTGLSIDFQVQPRSRVSDEDWDKPRIPINMYSGEPPPWQT